MTRTSPTVVIAPAVEADSGELWTLQRGAFVEEALVLGHPRIPPLLETLDELRIAVSETDFLKATIGTRIIGTGRLGVVDGVAWIHRLAIAPDMQGMGIGSKVLRALEALVPPDISRVELHTAEVRSENLAFYVRHGYTEVALVEETIGVVVVHFGKDI
jgi:ribosomal protein S18 acetylase RimI-like enzyme